MEKLRSLYEKDGASQYYGEEVTQYEHAIQAAYLAEKSRPDDHELIVAALLHDVGHLLGKNPEDHMGELGVLCHESVGAEYLRKTFGLSERICYLIRNHVNAKRYLTFVNKDYHDRLSETSKRTLVYQGGPMNESEADSFRSHPDFELCLLMRQFDEAAKDDHFDNYQGKADRYWNLVQDQISVH